MLLLSRKLTYIFLFLTVFTIPFQKSFIIPGLGSLNKIFGIVLAVVAIYTVLLKGNIRKLPLYFVLLFLFILMSFISYFWATVPKDAISKTLLYLQLGFIAWAMYEFACDYKRLDLLIKSYVLGCSVIALQSIYQYLTVGSNPLVSTSRFFIEGYNPNELGTIWAFGLITAMYLIVRGYKVYLLYVPLGAFTILLTGSRTALILVVFIGMSTLWMFFKYKVRFRKLITFTLVIASILIISKMPPEQMYRLSTIKYELSSGTLNGRTSIWNSGIETFKQNPMLGVGSGSFLEASVVNSATGVEFAAHNSYLSVLVENGSVGFIVFALMLATLFVSSYKIKKNNLYRWLCLTLITGWMILSFASHAEAQKYTWVIFGFIITAYYVSKKSPEPKVVKERVKVNKRRKLFKKRLVWQ